MTKQRREADGVTYRNGSYGYRISYRANGKRVFLTDQNHLWTRGDAVRERNKARSLIDAGKGSRAEPITVAAYLGSWLTAYERAGRRKASTVESARNVVERYLIPHIGHLMLKDLHRTTVEALYGDLLATGRTSDGGGLAPKTVRNIAGIFHKALSDGVKRGAIAINPADNVDLPRWDRPDLTVWDGDQVGQFLAYCSSIDEPHLAVWRLILATGMRRGEACGLRWSDVDFVAGTITISQTRVKAGTKFAITTPKTKASRRIVSIDAGTVTELARLLNALDAAAEAYSAAPFALVVTDLCGTPVHPLTLTRRFQRLARAAGLPVIRLHDARHTAATNQLGDGVPIAVVAARLGHTNAATTLSIYAHALPMADRNAAYTVGTALDDAINAYQKRTARTKSAPKLADDAAHDDTSATTKPNNHKQNDSITTDPFEATPGIE